MATRIGGEARRRQLTLAACILGSSIVLIDQTAVNVALPSIQGDLGGGLSSQQWVVNAYLLTLGSLLLIGGSLGDVLGERRVFAAGVAGFGATSLLCALAPTIELLVAARALQGVAGALLVPSALAVIVSTFPPEQRGAAIGSWTAWSGISTIIGPLLGGWLVDAASWRLIFAINVPFVVLALALIVAVVPARDRGRPQRRVDLVGAALCALGLAGPTYALIAQPALGWGSAQVLVPLVAGAGLLAAFLVWERRAPDAMLELSLFARRNFAIGNVQTLVVYAGLAVAVFFLGLYLQNVVGLSALEAGAAFVPLTLLMLTLAKRFGAFADRHGPRLPMTIGPLLFSAGLLLLLRADRDASYATDLLPAILVFGLGLAVTVAPLTIAVLADVDNHHAGIASGINNAIARVAGMLGTAGVGVLVAAQFAGTLHGHVDGERLSAPAAAALRAAEARPLGRVDLRAVAPAERARLAAAIDDASTDALHAGLLAAALLTALGGVIALVGIENGRRASQAPARARAEQAAG